MLPAYYSPMELAIRVSSIGGFTLEPYDPGAPDGDGDGYVQDGSPWERPAGTRVLDAAGKEIAKGVRTSIRSSDYRIVDKNNNPVGYLPKHPRSDKDTMRGPEKTPRKAKTPLGLLGWPTLGEMGSPTTTDYQDPPSIPKPHKPPKAPPATTPPDSAVFPIPPQLAAAIPPLPGETPIPSGWVRLYHYTGGRTGIEAGETIDSIKQFGLLMELSRGSEVGEPDAIWASPDLPRPDSVFVEFAVPANDPRVVVGGLSGPNGPSDVAFSSDISSREIIAVHEPWHDKYRYLSSDPELVQRTLDGEFDGLMGADDYGPAISLIKTQNTPPVIPSAPSAEDVPAVEPQASPLPYVPGEGPDAASATPQAKKKMAERLDTIRTRMLDFVSGKVAYIFDPSFYMGGDNNLEVLLDRWNHITDPDFNPAHDGPNRELIHQLMEKMGASTLEDLLVAINIEAEKRAATYLENAAFSDTVVSMPSEVFNDFLDLGRYLTQFEVNASQGILNPSWRSDIELDTMGIPTDIERSLRPVYGHADVRREGQKISDLPVSVYAGEDGGIHLILRDDLQDRTTTVYGDTSDRVIPISANAIDGSIHSNDRALLAQSDYLIKYMQMQVIDELSGGINTGAGYSYDASPDEYYYYEKQVHGGLSLEDVSTVVISGDKPIEEVLTPEQLKTLEDLGIRVVRDQDHPKEPLPAQRAVSLILDNPENGEPVRVRSARIQMEMTDLPPAVLEDFVRVDKSTGIREIDETAIDEKRLSLLGKVRAYVASRGSKDSPDRESAVQAAEDLEGLPFFRVALDKHISLSDPRPLNTRIDEERDKVGGLPLLPPSSEWPPKLPYDPSDPIGNRDTDNMEERALWAVHGILGPQARELVDQWVSDGNSLEDLGFNSAEDMEAALVADAQDILETMSSEITDPRRSPDIQIALPSENMLEVLNAGRYLTQFESDESGGVFNPHYRSETEASAFGIDPSLPDALRPVYGTIPEDAGMAVAEQPLFMGGQYGRAWLILKPDVRERSTYTLGDSLGAGSFGQPVNGGGDPVVAAANRSINKAMMMAFEGWVESYYDEGYPNDEFNFVEVQIHGGVSLYDIAEIHVPFDELTAKELAEVQRISEVLGIPVSNSSPELPALFVAPDAMRHEATPPQARDKFSLGRLSDEIAVAQEEIIDQKADRRMGWLLSSAKDAGGMIDPNTGDKAAGWDLLVTIRADLLAKQKYHLKIRDEGFVNLLDRDLERTILEYHINEKQIAAIDKQIAENEADAEDIQNRLDAMGMRAPAIPVVQSIEVTPPRSWIPSMAADMIARLRELRHGGAAKGKGTVDFPEYRHTEEQERLVEALAYKLFQTDIGGSFTTEDGDTGNWAVGNLKHILIDGGAGHLQAIITGNIVNTGTGRSIGSFTRTIYPDKNSAYHDSFSVTEPFQGSGIGRQFLTQTLTNLRDAGISKVNLLAVNNPESQMNGFSVWSKLGAEIVSFDGIGLNAATRLKKILGKELSEITAQDVKDYMAQVAEDGTTDRIMNLGVSARMQFDLTKGLPLELHSPVSEMVDTSYTRGSYGETLISYGELDFSVLEATADTVDSAYTDWSDFHGCQIMRLISAALIGEPPSPMNTEGDEYWARNPHNKAVLDFIKTGSFSHVPPDLMSEVKKEAKAWIEQTVAMLEDIEDSQPTTYDIYRGLSGIPEGSDIQSLSVGDEISLPFTAFAADFDTARNFAGADSPKEAVYFVLEAGAHAYAANVNEGYDHYVKDINGETREVPVEHIVAGDFVISDVSRSKDGSLIVTMKQTHTRTGRGRSAIDETNVSPEDNFTRQVFASRLDGSAASPDTSISAMEPRTSGVDLEAGLEFVAKAQDFADRLKTLKRSVEDLLFEVQQGIYRRSMPEGNRMLLMDWLQHGLVQHPDVDRLRNYALNKEPYGSVAVVFGDVDKYLTAVRDYMDTMVALKEHGEEWDVAHILDPSRTLDILETIRANIFGQIGPPNTSTLADVLQYEEAAAIRALQNPAGSGGYNFEDLTAHLRRSFLEKKLSVVNWRIADLQDQGQTVKQNPYTALFDKVRNSIKDRIGVALTRNSPTSSINRIGFAGDIGENGLAQVKAVPIGANGINTTDDAVRHLYGGGQLSDVPDVLVFDTLLVPTGDTSTWSPTSWMVRPELKDLYFRVPDLSGDIGENHLLLDLSSPGKGIFLKADRVESGINELIGTEIAHALGIPVLPGRWGTGQASSSYEDLDGNEAFEKRYIITEHAFNHIDVGSTEKITSEDMDGDPMHGFGLKARLLNHLLNFHMGVKDRHSGNVLSGTDVNGDYLFSPIDLSWASDWGASRTGGGLVLDISRYHLDHDPRMHTSGAIGRLIDRSNIADLNTTENLGLSVTEIEQMSDALYSELRDHIGQIRKDLEGIVSRRQWYVNNLTDRLKSAGASSNEIERARDTLGQTLTHLREVLDANDLDTLYEHYGLTPTPPIERPRPVAY